MKRFLSLFLALVVAVGICLSAPMTIEAEAYSVSRDDGVWLFPLTSYYYYNNFTDFAGCVGYANSACPFCGYAHPEYADPPNGHQWQANFGGHNGIDIGATTGTAVFAPASGVVIGSGMPSDGHKTRGITVMIKHDLGNGWAYYSYSQHLNKSYVSVGQTVAVGTTIGEVGDTGVGTGAHLHFGIVMAPSNYSFYQVLNVDCVGSTADNNWLTTSGYKTGKLVTNPKNGGTNMASVNAHRGSVTYTFDKNAVSINAATPTTGITLNATAKTLKIGDSLTLTATVTPSNATNKTVTWSSTNTNIATVSNGVVKAVANGVVDITAKASGGQTAICKVVVAPTTLTPAARTVIGNNVYEFYKEDYIGNDASTYAKNRGGYLVTLTSEEERNLVYNWVKSLAPSAVAISMGAYRTGETTFAWESGEAWGYAPWVSGEPNNTNGRENRAIMVMSSGNWNDITGDYSWPFVIEYSLDTYKSKGYDIEGIPVLKLPENPDMSNYKESTLYRYADKQFTTSANETLDGWTKYDSQTSYGDWGAVKTTLSKPTEGANLRITGTKTLYKYYHYWNYYDGMHCLDSIKYGTNKGYCEIYLTYQLSPVVFQDQGGRQGYGSYTCDKDKFNYWFFDKAYTQYSYQERTVTGTNYFYKWGNWSDWSTTPVTANDNRKVETKTSYTLTAHTHSASDWVITKNPTCTVEGTKVKKCTSCGEVMQTESIPVVAHIKSDWKVDKEATVKEAGSKHIECTVCKKVLETASIERLPLLVPTVKIVNTTNGINVSWNSVSGAEKYIVYRKTYNDSTKAWGGWETLTSNCTTTSYVDTKALLGVKYIYTAVAVAGDNKSSFVATSALLRDVAPTVKISNANAGINVTWNSVYGAQKYTVY
ncbi:MAG: hypothetical protein E7556_01655, partial [Ruminococcaceae bacterium]|nr:hypothetical protein [Oscillospiraceae bacterium]